jgi:hypothetical protein
MKENAKHLAEMVTPKDISRYNIVLKDNEKYIENELNKIREKFVNNHDTLVVKINFLLASYREMASWGEKEAAERTSQYAKDTLSGWTADTDNEYIKRMRDK